MLLVDGEKMSKSLGNFFTLAEVLEQHSAAALRLLMLQTSYRSPLDFSWERLEGAENSLTRIAGTVENLRWAANHATANADAAAAEAFAAKAAETRAAFKECMDDDFNTAGAMGAVFGFVTECNQYLEQAGDAADKAAALAAADTLAELLDTFGVELPESKVELPLGLLRRCQPAWPPTLVTTWTRQLPRFSRLAPRPVPPRTGIYGRRHPRPAKGPRVDD